MLQPRGITMWKLPAHDQSCVSGCGIWADGHASISLSLQCSFPGSISDSVSNSVFKHYTCPLDSIPVQQCEDIIFRLIFLLFWPLFWYPTLFCSLLGCRPLWRWSRISLHTPVSNAQYPLLSLFLKKPVPPSSNQYLFSVKLHGNACEFLINVSPLPNVITLSGKGKGETEEAGISRKTRNDNGNILHSSKCMKLCLSFHN